jgi:hypothetical protein
MTPDRLMPEAATRLDKLLLETAKHRSQRAFTTRSEPPRYHSCSLEVRRALKDTHPQLHDADIDLMQDLTTRRLLLRQGQQISAALEARSTTKARLERRYGEPHQSRFRKMSLLWSRFFTGC